MADLTTTIHETIEQHRYAYRPGDPICSCGWRPPKPNGELHSRHVAKAVERDLSGECLDEACRVVTRRRVRLVEPEWRDAQ